MLAQLNFNEYFIDEFSLAVNRTFESGEARTGTIDVDFDIKRSDTYTYKGTALNKTDSYNYNIDSYYNFYTTDKIDEGLYNSMIKGFEKVKDKYSQMLN